MKEHVGRILIGLQSTTLSLSRILRHLTEHITGPLSGASFLDFHTRCARIYNMMLITSFVQPRLRRSRPSHSRSLRRWISEPGPGRHLLRPARHSLAHWLRVCIGTNPTTYIHANSIQVVHHRLLPQIPRPKDPCCLHVAPQDSHRRHRCSSLRV